MSLINDALKRANQAQKTRPPVGPLGVPLQPADSRPGRHWVPVALVTAVLMVALGGAVWLVLVGWQSIRKPPPPPVATPPPTRQNANAAPAPKPPQAPARLAPKQPAVSSPPAVRQVQAPQPPSITPKPAPPMTVAPENPPPAPPVTVIVRTPPPVPVPSKPDATGVASSTASGAVASSKPVAPTAEPAPPAKPPFPELKLQGIFYLASRPSALISGKTVLRGDVVQGAKVVHIERLSVTLEFEGETKVLSLE